MAANNQRSAGLSSGPLIFGFLMGFMIGAVLALFNAPHSGGETRRSLSQNVRSTLESVTPTDPIAESIAEGKAAARRRRAELGLNS